MNRKKILCLIGQLGNGGTERQLYLFLKHLDKERYDASVVVSGKADGKWAAPIRSLGLPVSELGNINILHKFLKFRKITSRYHPDLIFSWNFFTNIFALAVPGRPFIGSLRGDLYVARKELGNVIWKLCLMPNTFVANSSLLEKELLDNGKAEDSIFTVKNIFDPETLPLDNHDRERIRRQYEIPSDAKVLIGAGRDTPEKNFDLFLDAFAKLKKINPSVHSIIIGSCADSISKKASIMGLKKQLILPGEVENPFEFFRASDIFFLSSRTEGMSNVLLEALSCGCAAVVMETGGIVEIKSQTPSGAITVIKQGEKIDSIAESINELLNRDLSVNGYKSVLDAFTPNKIMSDYYKIMDKI